MSELFAEHWALTLALQQFVVFFCFFHFGLIFISIDKVKLIYQRPRGELDPFSFNFSQ